MRGVLWAAVAAAVVALAAPERRADTDFEFDEAPEAQGQRTRRPRRFLYDPQNPLCRELVCKKREVCLLRDAFTAQCATKKEVLRRGDTIVAARREHGDSDDDVFYETRAPDRLPDGDAELASDNEAAVEADGSADSDDTQQLDRAFDRPPERCVGCGGGGGSGGAQFVCGSDNRTYSSLCRLDLHNCVRRVAVRLACRGFCPCRPAGPRRAAPAPAPAPAHRPAPPRLYRDREAGAGGRRGAPLHHLTKGAGAEGCELDKMADRLLDWFSVLMEEAGGSPPPARGFPRDCKPEVRWMFAHLDAARDGVLARDDLYALRHDERERCLRPFLASCAHGGRAAAGRARGGARGLTRAAWCGCLRRAARPCSALARAHPNPSPGAYVPACDARGFYLPRQCHAALGVCWCVDAHGVERPASRTKGQPPCPDERDAESGDDIVASDEAGDAGMVLDGEDEPPGPADDEDAGGSGDNELRF